MRDYTFPMRRMTLSLLLSAAVLSACSPRQQCLSDAASPYRAALREQARISEDLARGYTFKTRFEPVRRQTLCRGPAHVALPCWDWDSQPVTRKVPVDTAALARRQAEIAAILPALRAAAAKDTAQCQALYPEAAG